MRIINRTRKTLVGARVLVANTLWGRLRGYLGRGRPQPGEGILLIPCNAIHTFGMSHELDVIFLDSEGRILDLAPRLRPWRWTKRVSGARYVLEVPAGTVDETKTRVGDLLSWQLDRGASVLSTSGRRPGSQETSISSADEKGTRA